MNCVVDEKECYIYNGNAHGLSLLLNSVYEVIKMVYGGIFAEHPQRSLQCPQNPTFGVACPELQYIDIQGCSDPSNFSMSIYLPTSSHTAAQPEMLMSFENSPTATFHIDEKFLPKTLRNSFRVREHGHVHGESLSQNVVTRGYNIDTTRMQSRTDDDNIREENKEDENPSFSY
ncbi:unnamed protein product [Cochlearia groenlandica]